jgi:hypothetical protein
LKTLLSQLVSLPAPIIAEEKKPILTSERQRVEKTKGANSLDLAPHAPPNPARGLLDDDYPHKIRERIQPPGQYHLIQLSTVVANQECFHWVQESNAAWMILTSMPVLRRRALSGGLPRRGDTADDGRELLCRGAASCRVEMTTVIRQLGREAVHRVGAVLKKGPRPIWTG